MASCENTVSRLAMMLHRMVVPWLHIRRVWSGMSTLSAPHSSACAAMYMKTAASTVSHSLCPHASKAAEVLETASPKHTKLKTTMPTMIPQQCPVRFLGISACKNIRSVRSIARQNTAIIYSFSKIPSQSDPACEHRVRHGGHQGHAYERARALGVRCPHE